MALENQISQPLDASANESSAVLPQNELTPESLLGLFDQDAALLAELAELFLADSPALLSGIEAGVVANDASKVEHAAHALKGSVGNFGAERAAEAARRLESMGRKRDLAGAVQAFQELAEEIARVNLVLAALARPQPPEKG